VDKKLFMTRDAQTKYCIDGAALPSCEVHAKPCRLSRWISGGGRVEEWRARHAVALDGNRRGSSGSKIRHDLHRKSGHAAQQGHILPQSHDRDRRDCSYRLMQVVTPRVYSPPPRCSPRQQCNQRRRGLVLNQYRCSLPRCRCRS